jgi:hypothetical protein
LSGTGESEAAGPSGIRKHCIYNKEQNVINDFIQRYLEECEEGKLLHPVTAPIKRASLFTGVTRRMIQIIKREQENQPEGMLDSPLKSEVHKRRKLRSTS